MLDFGGMAEIIGKVAEVVNSVDGAANHPATEVIADLRRQAVNGVPCEVDANTMADLIEALRENGLVTDW